MKELEVLWNYLKLNMEPQKVDCIVGFGCINDDVAIKASELYLEGYAPILLFTGGLGRNTSGRWEKSEAERFFDIAVKLGVKKDNIIIENKSTNSGENIVFTKEKLEENNIHVSKILAVHKPYMERRVFCAIKKYWPEVEVITASAHYDLEEYIVLTMKQGLDKKEVIETIVGDFHRIDIYSKLGYQIKQDIPDEAWDAFNKLVSMGYTGQLIKSFN